MKPIQKEELLAAINQALQRDRTQKIQHAEITTLQSRFGELTSREREVMELVVSGLTNKEIAVTTTMHRGQVMRKMNAASLADLVRMSGKLKAAQL